MRCVLTVVTFSFCASSSHTTRSTYSVALVGAGSPPRFFVATSARTMSPGE